MTTIIWNTYFKYTWRWACSLILLLSLAILAPACSRYPDMAGAPDDVQKTVAAEPARQAKAGQADTKANPANSGKKNKSKKQGKSKPKMPLPAAAPMPSPAYVIGPDDVLKVRVWDHDDLSRDVTVSQNGNFNFPLIGLVKAGGRTAGQVELEVTQRLAEGYLKNPQVSLSVKDYRSQKVYVVGQVEKPGTFALMGPTRAVEVLSLASGVTDEAGTRLLVVRPRGEGRQATPTPLEEAQAGEVIELDMVAIGQGNISHDILLKHGDTIIVPEAEYFYVRGEINKPGKFKYTQGVTVIKAITVAGGAKETAALTRTRLFRKKNGKSQEIQVKLTDDVLPGDIITVPESYF